MTQERRFWGCGTAAGRSRRSLRFSGSATNATFWPMSLNTCRGWSTGSWSMTVNRPTTLLAELTHRCPLHCPYCSNPLQLVPAEAELATEDWTRVFTEARELGVLQLGLSGGEPLARRDLDTLAAHAHRLGLYTTLVTSGVGLTRARAEALREAGLEHIQISLQDADDKMAD